MSNAPAQKPSALSQLKALAQKKPAAEAPLLAAQQQDPALAGARRDKNTVLLGFDPGFAEQAAEAAQLKDALERAQSEFEILGRWSSSSRSSARATREQFDELRKKMREFLQTEDAACLLRVACSALEESGMDEEAELVDALQTELDE